MQWNTVSFIGAMQFFFYNCQASYSVLLFFVFKMTILLMC